VEMGETVRFVMGMGVMRCGGSIPDQVFYTRRMPLSTSNVSRLQLQYTSMHVLFFLVFIPTCVCTMVMFSVSFACVYACLVACQ